MEKLKTKFATMGQETADSLMESRLEDLDTELGMVFPEKPASYVGNSRIEEKLHLVGQMAVTCATQGTSIKEYADKLQEMLKPYF